ncbi:MAG TPA: alpha/beta hydrolase [Rhizobiaceae bacterium]|nr:alpha/beta hydrolase [Rhizobiaceae bacterium]
MNRYTERFRGADGNALIADVTGGGHRPVLLLHGGGQTRHAWDRTGERLAEAGMTAIAVDQRGHGESEWVVSKAYAGEDYARDVVALREHIHAQFGALPAVVGASLGGIASLAADRLSPGAMTALVLVDITPRMDPEGVRKIQGFMGERMHEGFASLEEAADAIARYLPHRKRPRSLDGLAKNLRLSTVDGRYRWHWDPAFLDGPRTINTGWEHAADDLAEAARGLTVPTLLVRGGQSELVPVEYAQEFLALAPHAEFVDVTDAGHMVAGDRNDVFSDAIIGFLQRVCAEAA